MLKREITKIILELKQIKLLLKNKNSIEVDDNTGQIASTVQGNQIQYNYFGYRSFIPLTNYDKNINARLKEGHTLEDFKAVIDKKTKQWLNDEKMSSYLRPMTLFGTKFESYLNEKVKGYVNKQQSDKESEEQ